MNKVDFKELVKKAIEDDPKLKSLYSMYGDEFNLGIEKDSSKLEEILNFLDNEIYKRYKDAGDILYDLKKKGVIYKKIKELEEYGIINEINNIGWQNSLYTITGLGIELLNKVFVKSNYEIINKIKEAFDKNGLYLYDDVNIKILLDNRGTKKEYRWKEEEFKNPIGKGKILTRNIYNTYHIEKYGSVYSAQGLYLIIPKICMSEFELMNGSCQKELIKVLTDIYSDYGNVEDKDSTYKKIIDYLKESGDPMLRKQNK